MAKPFKNSLFIFRRDLRIVDNTGLITAAELSDKIIPCFIFDPRQIGQKNEFRSMNAIQFMMEAIDDLENNLHKNNGKLLVLYGQTDHVIKNLIQSEKIDAIFVNRDYTPFAMHRDEQIKKECLAHKVAFNSYDDLLIHEPEEIKSLNGTPYEIFTPFFKRAIQIPARESSTQTITNWNNIINIPPLAREIKALKSYDNPYLHVHGKRSYALTILKSLNKFLNYGKTHDVPALETTNLSAFIKFGLVSIREVYDAFIQTLGPANPLVRQLYWRDFFTHVAYSSPFVFGQPFKQRYQTLPWDNNRTAFKAWCEGKTGFPIVDAGMRQLNQTGFMHNRTRLITASFLVKDLHIDWRWGEHYFAQNLVDYDPSVNNGNWQWVASTGTDSQPYFRIFNPWLQQQKFDPQCTYIKQWIPELKNVPARQIHLWYKQINKREIQYPQPLVDHTKETLITKKRYRETTELN